MKDRRKLIKLEDSALWQQSQKLAQIFQEVDADLSPEDRISAGYRIRSSAFGLAADIAEYEGATHHRDADYPLSMARKDAFSLKSSYRYLGVQKSLVIDPDVMLLLEKIISDLEIKINASWKKIDELEAETIKK